MPINFASLKAKDLERLDGETFQELCTVLLQEELFRRHVNPGVNAGAGPYTRDDGIDFLLAVRETPTEQRRHPHLTHDDVCKTVFSCKTGSTWADLVIRDLKPKKTSARPQKVKAGQAASETVQPPEPGVVVKLLAEGGRLTILVNRKIGATSLDKSRTKIVNALKLQFAGLTVPAELDARVSVWEAGHIAAFMQRYAVQLPPAILAALALPTSGHNRNFVEWTTVLAGRGLPDFVRDDARTTLLEQVQLLCTPQLANMTAERAIWLHGPPGSGKSRLVQEAIRRLPDQIHRVLVAIGADEITRALTDVREASSGNRILVLDECDPIHALPYANDALSHHHFEHARLIMIGPSPAPDDKPYPLHGLGIRSLRPLDDEATRVLIRQELGTTSQEPLVERVRELAEGYPWFTVLLARALMAEATPSHVDKQPEAAKLAIAGPCPHHDSGAWKAELTRRVAALFATLLTSNHEDWSKLSDTEQEALGNAVGLSWRELIAGATACWDRHILRRAADRTWRQLYVSPANLERLVAELHLAEPYNRELIRKHVPHRKAVLYKRLRHIGVRADVVADFAQDDLSALERADDEGAVDAITRAGPDTLGHLAYYLPRRTATWLRAWIERLTHAQRLELPPDLRRRVLWTLQHLTHRLDTLHDAEATVFLLALAETERYGNNATGVWTGIFHTRFNTTHHTLADRIQLLIDRCQDDSAAARALALEAVLAMIPRATIGSAWSHDDQADGEWPQPTEVERQQAVRWAWQQLLLMSDDLDPEVHPKARRLLTSHLRSLGLGTPAAAVIEQLASRVGGWQEGERIELHGALDKWAHFDFTSPGPPPPLAKALIALNEALAPRTYHDRLADAVAQYRIQLERSPTDASPSPQETLDRALATEGLQGDQPLLAELPWLDSAAATRRAEFMRQTGTIDTTLALLPLLEALAREGGGARLIPSYLAGIVSAQGLAPFDALHPTWRNDPHLLDLWLRGLMIFEASPHHAPWILAALTTGTVRAEDFGRMAWRPWSHALDNDAITPILHLLANDDSFDARFAAMDLIRDRAAHDPEHAPEHLDTLEALVRHLARFPLGTAAAWRWSQAARLLLAQGRAEAVVDAAMIVVESVEQADTTHGWDLWSEAVKSAPQPAWRRLAEVFLRPDRVGALAMVWCSHGSVANKVPAEVVLTWIGDDPSRAWRAALLTSAHQAPLNELARQLLIRWGPNSRPADELSARARSTPGVIHSFADFYAEQLERARQWATDPAPQVATWGRSMCTSLQRDLDEQRATEEFRRRQGA